VRYACDNRVTIVTKFPFMGGSLGGVCDLLVQHADSLLRLHFSRYQEMHTFYERLGHVVDTGKRSKSADQSVARKLWVVIWVVDDCIPLQYAPNYRCGRDPYIPFDPTCVSRR